MQAERGINYNEERTGRRRISKKKGHERNSCGYSPPNCKREFTELVTLEATFQVFE
jgi:hypothetical protein